MKKLELLQEFQAMNRIPMFEINLGEYLDIDEDEYEYVIFHIQANEQGIEAGSCSNCGFLHLDTENLFVEWDDCFSLDSHLEELFDKCVDYATDEYLEENK